MDKEVLSTPADAEPIDTSGDETRMQTCETGSQVDGHLGKTTETNKLRWKGLIVLAPVQILTGGLLVTSGVMSAKGCPDLINGYEEVSVLLGAIFALLCILMGVFTFAAATLKVKNMIPTYMSVAFFSIFGLGVPPLVFGVLEIERSLHFLRQEECETGLAMSLSMGTLKVLAGLSMLVTSVIGFAYACHALSRPCWTWDWRKGLCYMDCCIRPESSSLSDHTQEGQTNQDGHLDQDGHLILKPVMSDYCCCTQRNSKSSGAFTVLGILHLIVGFAIISINITLIFKGCLEMLRYYGYMYVIGILLGLLVAGHGLFGVCAARKKLSGLTTAFMFTSAFVGFGLSALIIYFGSFQVHEVLQERKYHRGDSGPTWQGALVPGIILGCVEIFCGILLVPLSLVTMTCSGNAVCHKGNASCLDTNKMPQAGCCCACCRYETSPRPTLYGDSDEVIIMPLKSGMDLSTISRDYPGYTHISLINPSFVALSNQTSEATTVDKSKEGVYAVTSREADA